MGSLEGKRTFLLGILVLGLVGCSGLQQTPRSNPSNNQNTGQVIPGQPALPQPQIPGPLPQKEGPVPLKMGVRPLGLGDQVQLRFLVIANDANDFGLPTWKAILDQVGAPYDVLLARETPLTPDLLVDSDGSGKYSAVLLTNNSLLYQDDSGNFLSAFDGTEWNVLWDYERNYKVRQVSLYTSYGTFPEDYCLRAVSEGGVSGTPLNASLTAAGAKVFGELKANVLIPITYSYVYRDSLAPGCTATALLTSGGSILGVLSPSSDGRERLALTFTTNQYLLQANLLTYSLIRWASKGVFLGERKHYLHVDVDDWFNSADERNPDGTYVPDGFRMSASDAFSTYQLQRSLVTKYKAVLPSFMLNLAYNGEGADLTAPANGVSGATGCNLTLASPDPLTSTSRCLRNDFRWINHTFSHPKMQNYPGDPTCPSITAAQVRTEIRQNVTVATSLGLNLTNRTVLKTGEYSGLGVYNPDCHNDLDPPTDFGLMASNPDLLNEAALYGVKYLHGNMSFRSHQPDCFNCGIYHPMKPSLLVVPDWPTNIAYLATTPDEETSIYNCFFGPNGTCAGGQFRYWPQDLTYPQIIDAETTLALNHLASGSVYSHTFHIANLRQYSSSPSRNLLFDWLDALVGKYATYFKASLKDLAWPSLGAYVANRTSHFSTLPATKAVWDRALGRVTVSSTAAGTLYLSGATATGPGISSETYNGNTISRLSLAAGQTVTLTPAAYVATLSGDLGDVNLQALPDPPDSPPSDGE
ncbi:hypothetical protein [Meiothermus granaticius]|uniref:Agd3 CBM87 domain-containing protein n=1 Tax=Meiothermus granaticius NBRC 107808 TaxID=1227551 RepID=A0A399FA24_9DEIN|nr:hypothetical protein [Meiothermus granaticius]RIH92565.1 hypothetical protein Mgrana_01465 [Meiothermus granaticius NBRC 107808]GEM88088.1 hypothetical protein MGR01S_27130 [Meiothermus granaticius NBRC 107808]